MPVDTAIAAGAQLLANARLAHAARRGQELADEIRKWIDAESIRLPLAIAQDRLSWTLTWEIDPPPLDVWGFIFGDAIHNLRATLDNLLSYIAREEGITDRRVLRRVQFPIVASRHEWEAQRRHVTMLPDAVQVAVELLQPFQFEGSAFEPRSVLLALLQELNNVDKHRLALVSGINPLQLSHEFTTEFEVTPRPGRPPRITVDAGFENGVVALSWDTSPDRIATVKGKAEWHAQVQVTDDGGESRGVTAVIGQVAHYLPQAIDAIVEAWLGPQ